MATITFDTLKFVERLEKAGVSREQASAMADAFKDASSEAELATKNDVIIDVYYPMTITTNSENQPLENFGTNIPVALRRSMMPCK